MNESKTKMIEASDWLASEFFKKKDFYMALKQHKTTCDIKDKYDAHAFLNFALIYWHLGDVEHAINYFGYYKDELSNNIPVEHHILYTQMLLEHRSVDAAMKNIENYKDRWEYNMDKSMDLFRKRKYEDAFNHYSLAKKQGNLLWIGKEKYDNLPPTDLNGDDILLVGECGFGDQFIFSRWIPSFKEKYKDKKIYFYSTGTIEDVICRCFGLEKYIPGVTKFSGRWFTTMDLPNMLREYNPSLNQYQIIPTPEHLDKWRAILGESDFPMVALCWEGNEEYSENVFRSVNPLLLLKNEEPHRGIKYISVCLADKQYHHNHIRTNHLDMIKSWEDTLAILWLCDKTISTCTAVAHASSILGKPTDVIVRNNPYFTWSGTEHGGYSDWYQRTRVFYKQLLMNK